MTGTIGFTLLRSVLPPAVGEDASSDDQVAVVENDGLSLGRGPGRFAEFDEQRLPVDSDARVTLRVPAHAPYFDPYGLRVGQPLRIGGAELPDGQPAVKKVGVASCGHPVPRGVDPGDDDRFAGVGAQSAFLSDRVERAAVVASDRLSPCIDDFAGNDSGNLRFQELGVGESLQETDAHALPRPEGGRERCGHRFFDSFAHRRQGYPQVFLRQAPQVIGLIFGRVGGRAHEVFSVFAANTEVVSGGDMVVMFAPGDVVQRFPFDPGIAASAGRGRFAAQVAAGKIADDLFAENFADIFDPERKVQPSGRLPDARFETLFPDGIQRKQRDGMALFGEVPRRRRAVDAAAEAQQYVFSHTE